MDELLTALKGIHKQSITIESATVKSVDSPYSITVITTGGVELPDVRLKAGIPIKGEDKEYIVIVPRVKSSILIGLINNDDSAAEYIVLSVNEFDSISIINKKEEFSIVQEKEMLVIKNKLQKIEFLRDTINISAGGENKTYVSLQDDKALVWAKTGKIILVSEETNIKNVLMAISDAFTALSKATCPPNAPLVTAPCLADFQKVTAEINKFTQ